MSPESIAWLRLECAPQGLSASAESSIAEREIGAMRQMIADVVHAGAVLK